MHHPWGIGIIFAMINRVGEEDFPCGIAFNKYSPLPVPMVVANKAEWAPLLQEARLDSQSKRLDLWWESPKVCAGSRFRVFPSIENAFGMIFTLILTSHVLR